MSQIEDRRQSPVRRWFGDVPILHGLMASIVLAVALMSGFSKLVG